MAAYVEFMGYTQPWYSVRGVDAPIGGDMGHIICFLRDGDRVFLTYSTTGRGNEPVNGSFALLDMTPYGRGEGWEDNPEGWPGRQAGRRSVGTAGLLVLALGRRRERQLGPDQPARAAVDAPRRDPRGDPRPARAAPLTRWCRSGQRVARVRPWHTFGVGDAVDVQVDDDRVLAAAGQHALQRLVVEGVDLLVWHERRDVDEPAGPRLVGVLQPLPQRIRARPRTT